MPLDEKDQSLDRTDYREEARDVYENSGITLKELSKQSLELVGAQLSLSILKRYSAEDGWRKDEQYGDYEMMEKLMELINDKLYGPPLSVQEIARLTESYGSLIRIKDKLNMLQRVSEASPPTHGRTSAL